MARTRGSKSSFLSSRKRAAPQTPVQGSTSKPPRPPRVPPPVEGAPMSPPVRRYHTRASSQPPKKKAKVFEPALIDLSEPEEPATEPQSSQPSQPPPLDSQIPSGMTPEMIIKRPMLTQPPIEGNLTAGLGHSTPSSVLMQPLSDSSPSSGTPSICSRGIIWNIC
ncbi:hypothetical protein CK203_044183 [Vitis vinifera]|uniref:Uncharacterized protein n=1 Tax=Vitis vinifera TaxID=29760 RepID=A0A438I2K0_VITVI|nr:hypothetical protein CK203_044183 [Vitis vinifera]